MADQRIEDKSKPADDPVNEIKNALADAEGALAQVGQEEEVLLGDLESSVQAVSQTQQTNTVSAQINQPSGSSATNTADDNSVPAVSIPNLKKTQPDGN